MKGRSAMQDDPFTRKVFLKMAICLCLAPTIGACSSEGPGENWSIGVGNASIVHIGYTELCNPQGTSCWSGQTLAKAANPKTAHIAGYGGSTFHRDSNSFIPEDAVVSWYGPVREEQSNQEFKQAPFHGPYLVKIRSTIPPDILAKAKRDGYMLEIGVTAGVVPPDVDWRLMYMGRNFGGPSRLIARGGPRAAATEQYEREMAARMEQINRERAKQRP
jgi:hypothetical protein